MKNAIVCLIFLTGLLFSCSDKQQKITLNDFDRLIRADSIESIQVMNDYKAVITKINSKSGDEKLVLPIASAHIMREKLENQYPGNKVRNVMYVSQINAISTVFQLFPLLLFLSFLVFFLIAAIDILKSRFVSDVEKLIWIIVVIFVPLIGAILYLIIGRKQKMKLEK